MSNRVSPIFEGSPTSRAYKIHGGRAFGSVFVNTSSSTPVNVFGSTNGFSGSVVGIRTIAKTGDSGNITLKSGTPTADPFAETTVAVVAKGTTAGGVAGSAIGYSSGAFVANGTLTAVTSGGDVVVEVIFLPS